MGGPLDIGEEAGCFGAPKKEVMVAFALGFFEVDVAMSAAFRLRGVAILTIEEMVKELAHLRKEQRDTPGHYDL